MDESGYIWSTYYISLIVIGSFFMLNLVLGVLSGWVRTQLTFVMRCAMWYYLYHLNNVKNTHGGVFICNFTKINFPPWVFLTFFKL